MIPNIDNQALSLINLLDDAHTIICELRDKIITAAKPSDLLDDINTTENSIKSLESKISMTISTVNSLRALYCSTFSAYKDVRNSLSVKINEHKMNELPYNTSGTFYDENNLLKEIYVSSDSRLDPGIQNVLSDEIIDAKDYSCLSIVNKFYKEGNLLDELMGLSRNLCTSFENNMRNYNSQLLELKDMINNPETLLKLSEESTETSSKIKEMINSYTYRIETARSEFIKLFNIYLDIKNNYEIYKTVIDSYTRVVLESLFNSDSVYEIC